MKLRNATIAAAAAAALAAAALAAPVTASAHSGGLKATGLAGGGTKLVRFDTEHTRWARKVGSIAGLSGDTSLIGIDRRVQNGKLYGVGNAGGIYTLSTRTAKATKVGQLSVALSGTAFGVDFNPAANALRIVSDTGQNLRQPFGTGDEPSAPTVVDGTLNYVGATALGVSGAAYTNNDLDPTTATTLFDIDAAMDQVAIQSPANSGALAATGKLGIDAGSATGFDIYSKLRQGKTVGVAGYAIAVIGGESRLYSIDLLTGAAAEAGRLPHLVTDLAIDLDD